MEGKKKNDPLTCFDIAQVALLHGSVTKLVLCRRRLLSITAAVRPANPHRPTKEVS